MLIRVQRVTKPSLDFTNPVRQIEEIQDYFTLPRSDQSTKIVLEARCIIVQNVLKEHTLQ